MSLTLFHRLNPNLPMLSTRSILVRVQPRTPMPMMTSVGLQLRRPRRKARKERYVYSLFPSLANTPSQPASRAPRHRCGEHLPPIPRKTTNSTSPETTSKSAFPPRAASKIIISDSTLKMKRARRIACPADLQSQREKEASALWLAGRSDLRNLTSCSRSLAFLSQATPTKHASPVHLVGARQGRICDSNTCLLVDTSC